VAVYATASDDGAVQVHLGPNFPLTMTLKSATVDGKAWAQVTWQTPGRHGTGWVEASALTMIQPSGGAMASFDALDTALAEYLSDYGTRVGVQLLDLTRGVVYGYNADRPYLVASSMKVPIMLTLLTQLEAKGRGPNAKELSLLTTMIENSNNKSATALYKEIGQEAGINAFMKQVGITGLTPQGADPGEPGWGWSTITPAAMVSLLELLHEGKVLNAKDRALALKLMEHIQADQRVGVGDSSPAGATIALKDGWVLGPDDLYVMNSSGIVTLGAETYILAVYTMDDNSWNPEGFAIVRHICKVIGARMVAQTSTPTSTPQVSPSA
jgi:beta-lactamase class A